MLLVPYNIPIKILSNIRVNSINLVKILIINKIKLRWQIITLKLMDGNIK